MNDREMMLKKINEISFTMYELHLYLDTHPTDTTAMALLNRYKAQRAELVAAYESKYGPLDTYNVTANNRWQWIANPWPWDYDSEA